MSLLVMKSLLLLSLGGMLLAPAVNAQVFINVAGSDATGYVANRFGQSGATSTFVYGNSFDTGGEGVFSDTAELDESRGTFQSRASISGDVASFISIGTYAATKLNAAVEGTGGAAQAFTYNGAAPASFTIGLSLSGTLVNSTNNPSLFSGNFGNAYVIISDYDNAWGLDSLLGAFGEGISPDASASVSQTDEGSTLFDTTSFTVNPGESFYVSALGYSRMYGEDGVADAFSSLAVGFTAGPTGDLTALAIPEPTSFVLLLGLGASLFAGSRRRR